jgi:hypothetical protein
VLAASRDGAEPGFWAEEDPLEAAALEPPVGATPVKALCVEGVLSMQILLEEGAPSTSTARGGGGGGGEGSGADRG